jgi:hypothetical protein
MAIVQISRITQRKGLQENLPQLAGAELGWSIDERRLFIGNGTLEEGAPVIGNTEILTQFSDIFEFQSAYTYKGLAAGYEVQTGPTSGTPITQSLQNWLDQFATVKDFGAVGDGVADDTAAINRALQQLFCREANPQIRRSLFFPAGVYLVSETIIIPPYATLYGEGQNNSIIQLTAGDDSALRAYVARTGDSLQQTGVNIGNNGAIVPQYVTVMNMGFKTQDADVDVFLVEDAANCTFRNVNFTGPLTTSGLTTAADNIAGVRFASTPTLICNSITFDRCVFSGLTYGVDTDQQVQGITVSNSNFDTLYQGVSLGTTAPVNGGPTGFRITHSVFDNIYAQGIILGNVNFNATGYNMFYDVGNHFNGTTNPATSVITIGGNNNTSIADMFERTTQYSLVYRRVDLNGYQSTALVDGATFEIGPSTLAAADTATLVNNQADQPFLGIPVSRAVALTVTYTIIRDTGYRIGTIVTTATGGGTLTYCDDYTENEALGITLSVIQSGSNIVFRYTASNTGIDGEITYQLSYKNL